MVPHRSLPSSCCLVWPASPSLAGFCSQSSSLFSLPVVGTSSRLVRSLLWHREDEGARGVSHSPWWCWMMSVCLSGCSSLQVQDSRWHWTLVWGAGSPAIAFLLHTRSHYIFPLHNFLPVFVWHSLTHPSLFNESHFTRFCITAEEGQRTKSFCNPMKIMLCYKLNNLPVHNTCQRLIIWRCFGPRCYPLDMSVQHCSRFYQGSSGSTLSPQVVGHRWAIPKACQKEDKYVPPADKTAVVLVTTFQLQPLLCALALHTIHSRLLCASKSHELTIDLHVLHTND